jgi:hypothetical protein
VGLLLILILIFKYEVGYFSELSWFYNYTTITTIRTIYTITRTMLIIMMDKI